MLLYMNKYNQLKLGKSLNNGYSKYASFETSFAPLLNNSLIERFTESFASFVTTSVLCKQFPYVSMTKDGKYIAAPAATTRFGKLYDKVIGVGKYVVDLKEAGQEISSSPGSPSMDAYPSSEEEFLAKKTEVLESFKNTF